MRNEVHSVIVTPSFWGMLNQRPFLGGRAEDICSCRVFLSLTQAFDAVLNAIVMELQRTQGAKVKLTLEVEAVAEEGFADNDVSVVRDNARKIKFKPESTGFED